MVLNNLDDFFSILHKNFQTNDVLDNYIYDPMGYANESSIKIIQQRNVKF